MEENCQTNLRKYLSLEMECTSIKMVVIEIAQKESWIIHLSQFLLLID